MREACEAFAQCGLAINDKESMLTKTEAIVLRSFKYGDNKLITDLFTRSGGRLSFVATVSARGKLKKQYFQPLSLLEVEYDMRPKLQLQKLTAASINVAFADIPFNPTKLSISLFLAEFMCRALNGERQGEPLFSYIADSLRWLDGSKTGIANFHLVFLMRLTRFLGFFPNLDNYSDGDFFDLRSGCFCTQKPLHNDCLATDDARRMTTLMRMNYHNMHLFRLSRDERNRLLDVALRYYEIHLPDFPQLKSVDVLREMSV